MQSVIILGGDERSRFLDKYFRSAGFFTYCFGLGEDVKQEMLYTALRSNMAALILPLPASRDGETVNMPNAETKLTFRSLCELLPAGSTVFGGMLPAYAVRMFSEKGAQVVDYYDEEVIVQNAHLTAVGTLRVLSELCADSPCALRIAVTGFGRVAKAVAKILSENGCVPTVAARRADARAEALHAGYEALEIADLQNSLSCFDVVINTVPAQLFSKACLSVSAPTVGFIDLASAPFGVDFDAAGALGIAAVNAQSLPGKYTPQAAAEIVGEKIKKLLSEG